MKSIYPYTRILPVLQILLLVSCGGGSGTDTDANNNTTNQLLQNPDVDTSGVWVGDIGYGQSTLIIDGSSRQVLGIITKDDGETNEPVTVNDTQVQYYAVSGTASSFSARLDIYPHNYGLGTPNSPRGGWGSRLINYSANFIEQQTATITATEQMQFIGQDVPLRKEFLLIYTPEYREPITFNIAGTWKHHTKYKSGQNPVYFYKIDEAADPLLQHVLDVSIEIGEDGVISGTETLISETYKGLNENGDYICPRPCMEEEYVVNIDGAVLEEFLPGHTVPRVTLSITGQARLERKNLKGFLLPTSDNSITILVSDPDNGVDPYVLELSRI